MKIAILTQVYPPEIHPTAVMVRELAIDLQRAGWDVWVVTGYPHHPQGVLYPGFLKQLYRRQREDGVDVLRTWHVTHPSRAIPIRFAVFVSQALGCLVGGLWSDAPDVVLVYGPPLVGPVLGSGVALAKHAKLVNVIYDIYPDIAIETGAVTNPAVIAIARAMERYQHWATTRTIVLSAGLGRQLVAKGVEPARVSEIPLWMDIDEIRPMSRDNRWRDEQGIPRSKTVVLYAGTIGVVSGAPMVCETAARLRDREDLLFLFVGEGAAKDQVQRRAEALDLPNMRFLPFQPRERLRELQATADIGLVTLLRGRGRTSVPSKVLGYMAAARPVIASVDADSDSGREIADHNLGLVVPPEDPLQLADGVVALADDPTRRQACGRNGRQRMESHYEKHQVLSQYRAVLEEVACGSSAG